MHDQAAAAPAQELTPEEKLDRWSDRASLPLTLSALLPIVVALSRATEYSPVSIVVNVVSWFVFIADLVVHMRYRKHYLRSGNGIFDLTIVILTAPWFLIPGLGNSQILMLARLGRLVRLFYASPAARRVMRQLGMVGVFFVAMVVLCSWMAYVNERGVNSEFADYGDALWWGVVTVTTVGYGDITPITEKGRVAGTFLMFTGVATLGILSGTLASFFRSNAKAEEDAEQSSGPRDGATTADVGDLRAQLDRIEARLAELEPSSAREGSGSG